MNFLTFLLKASTILLLIYPSLMTGPNLSLKVKEISSYSEIENLHTESNKNSLLVVVNNSDLNSEEIKSKINMLSEVSVENNYDQILLSNSQNLISSLNLYDRNFTVFSILYNKKAKKYYEPEMIDFDMKKEFQSVLSIDEVIKNYKYPLYDEIEKEAMNTFIETGEPTMILFYGSETSNSSLSKANEFMKDLAGKYRRDLHIFNSHIKSVATSVIVEVLRLKPENLPLLLITQMKDGVGISNNEYSDELDKFKLENVKLTRENVEEFIFNWKTGNVLPFLASEEIPEDPTDENGIMKVVGKTFDDFITTQGVDLVLAVCSHLSKKCKRFNKRLARVAEKLRNNKKLIIAQTDPNFNEYSVNIEPKFPSIFFFLSDEDNLSPTDRFSNRMVFDGDYNTRNITHFIAQNSRHSIRIETLEEEDKINEEEDKMFIESSLSFNEDEDFNFGDFLKEELKLRGEDLDLASLLQDGLSEEELIQKLRESFEPGFTGDIPGQDEEISDENHSEVSDTVEDNNEQSGDPMKVDL